MATKKPAANAEMVITTMIEGEMTFCVLGTTPLIFNRLPEKARRELLMPYKKTAADKAGNLKHDPVAEFRASPYRMKREDAPTVLAVLPTMFKQAMCTAALRTEGATKTVIQQLVRVDWENIPVYGVPKVFCAIARSADQNKTPDVRTRAMLAEWACFFTVKFQKPILREQGIAELLSTAGRVSGICDWRQEKGSGSFGSFRLVSADDSDFLRIMKTGGRAAQQAAMDAPEAYDDDTRELLGWFDIELKRRGFKTAAPKDVAEVSDAIKVPRKKSNGSDESVLGRHAQ